MAKSRDAQKNTKKKPTKSAKEKKQEKRDKKNKQYFENTRHRVRTGRSSLRGTAPDQGY